MKWFIAAGALLLLCHTAAAQATAEDPELSPRVSLKKFKGSDERIREHGYPVESHYAETPDGYVLNLFRIPYSHKLGNQLQQKPAVLLQHGLFSNSDCWLCSGPDHSLAYLFADAGYDVWLGNARGNIYSRNNTKMSLKHPYFWRFSWHEIGTLDVATMIDYIIEQTGETKIHYAGHSQGTTVYFVLMSERPEYNAKVKTAHMVAPCAFFEHGTSFIFDVFRPLVGKPSYLPTKLLQDMELIPQNWWMNRLIDNTCNNLMDKYCDNGMYLMGGDGYKNTNFTSFKMMTETHPGGTSSNQGIHFIQLSVSYKFRQYDWGESKNRKLYGQDTPPDYDLSKITAPTYMYSSQNDGLCNPKDVDTLVSKIPGVFDIRLEDESWNHLDYVVGNQMREYVNDPIIANCEAYENAIRQ